MKRLNNNGWGLGIFITFICVFFIAIIMIIYVSNKYNIGIENVNKYDDKGIVEDSNKDLYESYEKEVKEAAIMYQEKNYPNISNGEMFYTNILNLNISSKIYDSCTGYVEFSKKNDIYYYIPFLDCGSYKSQGYNLKYDK